MSEGKALKVRVTFAIILVGVALMFTAVVTDHWAVLSPKVEKYNATCEAAHFGLWRICTKRIYIEEAEMEKVKGCGPISHPGGMSLSLSLYLRAHCINTLMMHQQVFYNVYIGMF